MIKHARFLGLQATVRTTDCECWIGAAWGVRDGARVVLLGVPFCVVAIEVPPERVPLTQWLREITWHAE